MAHRTPYPPASDHERGSASVFFLLTATAVVAAAGLLIDGGEILAGKAQTIDNAEQAARTGAQQLRLDRLRSGQIALQPAQAAAAVNAYLRRYDETGTATVTADHVTVTARRTIPSRILAVFGIPGLTATGTGTATLVPGIAAPDDTAKLQKAQP